VGYNVLTAQVLSRKAELNDRRNEAFRLHTQIEKHDALEPSGLAGLAESETRRVASLDLQLSALGSSIATANERAQSIYSATLPGWKPSYWFSEDRSRAKKARAQLSAEIETSESNKSRYSDERDRALAAIAGARQALEEHSAFDRREAEKRLVSLGDEIDQRAAELERLEAREKALADELEVPLREFLERRARLDVLKADLQRANRIERELGNASNSYERKQLHDECKSKFGTGSPREVIRNAEKAIASEERNSKKLERRLRAIERRSTLEIDLLVIDGSNLCYEGDKLIGLFALREVCAQLPDSLDVIVVFDGSIRKKLGVSDDTLRSQLRGTRVHIAASKAGADQTILDSAQAKTAFVLSNDTFAEFPDKSVVQEDRLLRHEIIGGRVMIEDLSIEVEYSNRSS